MSITHTTDPKDQTSDATPAAVDSHSRRFVAVALMISVMASIIGVAGMSPGIAEAAGYTDLDTHTTCTPGALNSTMSIAGGRNQLVAAQFYIEKYNFSRGRWERYQVTNYAQFRLSHVDPINNAVGLKNYGQTFSGVPAGAFRVWAHVFYRNESTNRWTGETWALSDTVDYLVNGQYWYGDGPWCSFA